MSTLNTNGQNVNIMHKWLKYQHCTHVIKMSTLYTSG